MKEPYKGDPKNDGFWKFIERVRNRVLRWEELTDDYKDTVDYVVSKFIKDGENTVIVSIVFGLDGEPPITANEAAKVLDTTAERVRMIVNQEVTRIRHDRKAMMILENGITWYKKHMEKKSRLIAAIGDGKSAKKIAAYFKAVPLEEITLISNRYYKALRSAAGPCMGRWKYSLYDFMLLTDDDMFKMHGIGEVTTYLFQDVQESILRKYSTMSVKEFQQACKQV